MTNALTAKDCVVILPTYNERENIASVIEKVVRNTGIHVLVVDDGSPDGTADVVRKFEKTNPNVHIIVRARKLGLGSAYMDGFSWALERQFSIVGTMDADHSHDPSLLSSFIDDMADADLVIGSRYVAGGSMQNMTIARRLISGVANGIVRCSLRGPIRDCTSGYRLYSAAFLRTLDLNNYRSQGFSMLVELLHEAVCRNARIVERPITFVDRSAGKSKLRAAEIFESLALYGYLTLVHATFNGRRKDEQARAR